MRLQSDSRPAEIWIKYVDRRGIAFVRLRRDIKEIGVLDIGAGKSRTVYDYEEVKVEIVDALAAKGVIAAEERGQIAPEVPETRGSV